MFHLFFHDRFAPNLPHAPSSYQISSKIKNKKVGHIAFLLEVPTGFLSHLEEALSSYLTYKEPRDPASGCWVTSFCTPALTLFQTYAACRDNRAARS